MNVRSPRLRRAATTLALACAAMAASTVSAHAADRLIVGFASDSTVRDQVQDLRASGVAATAASVTSHDLPAIDAATVSVPSGTADEVARKLRARDGVDYVEVDQRVRVQGVPNDPRFGEQWGLASIGAPAAWDTATGIGVTIAVVDTGVDYTHPELAGRVDLGHDFVANDEDPMDQQGHGTHVAGIAAASSNNGVGVAGVATDSRILAVRVLDADGSGYYSWIANGITYAADHGAKVINLSLGGTTASQTLKQAVDYATAKGAFVACASGNDGNASVGYPASYDSCFSVGATTQSDQRASFSNYGDGLDITAPGAGILSTVKGPGYESWSGTSMATPFVSGVAALLASKGLNRGQIDNVLRTTAADLGPAGYDTSFGYGRLNASAAVGVAASLPALPADPVAPTVSGVQVGESTSVSSSNRGVRWRTVRTTKWRVVKKAPFAGKYAWSTEKSTGGVKQVFQYRIRKGKLTSRTIVMKKVSTLSVQSAQVRTVTISASDNVAVDRAGLAVDGQWVDTDWNGADGWHVQWKCAAGSHTFTAYAFDASSNQGTASVTQTITC